MVSNDKTDIKEVCADCNQRNPSWSSLNRCVLLCDSCCYVHRSLGRHLSQVKSLNQHKWRTSQLKMLKQIVAAGSNKIWEYLLFDPKRNKDNIRKPTPDDSIHPSKAEFIKKKYQFLAFCKRYKDSEICSLEDMNMQLHASVRTPNLETSFRLLTQGANPNFYHPHKRNTPLHVATQEKQTLQIELLLIYGANPLLKDANGKTAIEISEEKKLTDIKQILVESQYELTDRVSGYLGAEPPDHTDSNHFALPRLGMDKVDKSTLARDAKVRLATLPDSAFQELCCDLYDELDRRENNNIVSHGTESLYETMGSLEIFFLPLNPYYSSTRNQGRQKLARFNDKEFNTLLLDVLEEAARRCGIQPIKTNQYKNTSSSLDNILDSSPNKKTHKSFSGVSPILSSRSSAVSESHLGISYNSSNPENDFPVNERLHSLSEDPDPVYDQVPADSEYAFINPSTHKSKQVPKNAEDIVIMKLEHDRYREENEKLKMEVERLTKKVLELSYDNDSLRRKLSGVGESRQSPVSKLVTNSSHSPPIVVSKNRNPSGASSVTSQTSNYSAGSSAMNTGVLLRAGIRQLAPRPHTTCTAGSPAAASNHQSRHDSGKQPCRYENVDESELPMPPLPPPLGSSAPPPLTDRPPVLSVAKPVPIGMQPCLEEDTDYDQPPPETDEEDPEEIMDDTPTAADDLPSPTQEEVLSRTEAITTRIYKLLEAARQGRTEQFPDCSANIHEAVLHMIAIIPKNRVEHSSAVSLLLSASTALETECGRLRSAGSADLSRRTQQVIQCSFDIAKAAKAVVTLFQG